MTRNTSSLNISNAVYFLGELRARLFRSLLVLFGLLIILMYFANQLYTFLALPLLKFLPQGHLIATEVVAPFFVPFKLAFMSALLVAMPYFLYQAWAFISPALYRNERNLIWPFLALSVVLFYGGIAFAYFVIFPMLFKFLSQVAPQGVQLSPDINEYLDFTTKLIFTFGVLFEIPMFMMILVVVNLVSWQKFVAMRSYAIVGAFVLGMLLAPPDVLSQTMLALPIWMLYEIGIVLAKLVKKRKGNKCEG